jgi:hypothetical protein
MIKPHTSLLAISCFVALASYAGIQSQAEPKLATESYMIPSRDPGIQLYVRNKRPDGMTQFSPEKTLLYVQGAALLKRHDPRLLVLDSKILKKQALRITG